MTRHLSDRFRRRGGLHLSSSNHACQWPALLHLLQAQEQDIYWPVYRVQQRDGALYERRVLSGLQQLQADAREHRRLQQLHQPVDLRDQVPGMLGRLSIDTAASTALQTGIAKGKQSGGDPSRIHSKRVEMTTMAPSRPKHA